MTKEKGKIFIVSAPSGSGKNTVMNEVMALFPKMRYSISATTRAMRPGETDGVSYYFVSEKRFDEMLEKGELLEHTGYVGHRYGTPAKPLLALVEDGYDVVMDVDVVGGLAIKEKIPEAVLVFLVTPSIDELRRRLVCRGDVAPDVIEQRIAKAYEELPKAELYDYIVVNDDLKTAVDEMRSIVTAEKCKTVERFHFIKEELSCSTPL